MTRTQNLFSSWTDPEEYYEGMFKKGGPGAMYMDYVPILELKVMDPYKALKDEVDKFRKCAEENGLMDEKAIEHACKGYEAEEARAIYEKEFKDMMRSYGTYKSLNAGYLPNHERTTVQWAYSLRITFEYDCYVLMRFRKEYGLKPAA